MKKTILSILITIAALFAIDRIGGQLMWWVNQHSNDSSAPKIKYLVDGVHEEVVLMGTSRCQGHYIPSIISDTLSMSVYNGCVDASSNIFSHYIMLSHVLAKHSPKVICLDLNRNDLYHETDPFTAISFFAPYYGRNESADSVYVLAGTAWQYGLSHLYRFNSKAPSNILGLFQNKLEEEGADNGYLPISNPKKPLIISEDIKIPRETEIDNNKYEYLCRFISQCKSHNVFLIFVISPSPSHVNEQYYSELKKIAEENKVPFLDYHTKGLFLDHPEYFKDGLHLCDMGARAFTPIFSHDLKRIIESNR